MDHIPLFTQWKPEGELSNLSGEVLNYSMDPSKSRTLQHLLKRASDRAKQNIFYEMQPFLDELMMNCCGNFVVQLFLEIGSLEQKAIIASRFQGRVLAFAAQTYSCRVLQKALDTLSPEHRINIALELHGHVFECAQSSNASFVLQKCLYQLPSVMLSPVLNEMTGRARELCLDAYGCRIVQAVLQMLSLRRIACDLHDEICLNTAVLIMSRFGNFVLQKMLAYGPPRAKTAITEYVRENIFQLSQDKYASNVVEVCFTKAGPQDRAALLEKTSTFNAAHWIYLLEDPYGNFVVQQILDIMEPAAKLEMAKKIKPNLHTLSRYSCGKALIPKLKEILRSEKAAVHVASGPRSYTFCTM